MLEFGAMRWFQKMGGDFDAAVFTRGNEARL